MQDRVKNRHLSESQYMLGVSDYMRMGALRLSYSEQPDIFLAENTNIPKLMHLNELELAIRRLENGQETESDIAMLAQPGSSLGGAHPKASVEDNGQLYIAKFQSKLDRERVSLWEATMLSLAKRSEIMTANFKILNKDTNNPILLVERFDRQNRKRIPFVSAMTILERSEKDLDKASYIEIVDAITRFSSQPQKDKLEFFKRMVFNIVTGNIDDHLRNHGFLREVEGWRLSPAYNLNPTNELYHKRNHNLSFDGEKTKPSLELCLDLAEYFNLNDQTVKKVLKIIAKAVCKWELVASNFSLKKDEINRMRNSFEHEDFQMLLTFI